MSICASNERIIVNKLEAVILDQQTRIAGAGLNPTPTLEEATGEILAVATPELTREIISNTVIPESETRSTNARCRAIQSSRSVTNRSVDAIRAGHSLARMDMLLEGQGYTGGIIFDGDDRLVYGRSMRFGDIIATEDPIQTAMGSTFYPPMMWAKALRAEAYRQRPDSARELSAAEYMAELGLSLGCVVTDQGDIAGATGFMPGERLSGSFGVETIDRHVQSEEVEAFRLSGLCDQAVVEPGILQATPEFAAYIIALGGSLN